VFLFPKNPRDLADSIGLDWWAARKLYDDKWLSFDPEITLIDNDAMQTEFVFLGSLVAAGCDPHMLKRLLAGLGKPYSYDFLQIYYDWSERSWKDLPYEGSPVKVAEEILTELEEEGDCDSLNEISKQVHEAINRLNEEDDSEDISEDIYDFDPERDNIVRSARHLLWKIAGSPLVDTPGKTVAVGKLFRAFQRLPRVTADEGVVRLDLVGPRRKYGDHEIYHFWAIELTDEGELAISCGGHFYRPQTGGDSFTTMTWNVAPGCEPGYSDYLHTLSIVDDADTFEGEVACMDLQDRKYTLTVGDDSLEGREKDAEE
jgi:hypothetical protein